MIYKSKRNAKRQKVLNWKIILPVIIILGVITRPFWKKIFAKPAGMIVEFSEKNKNFLAGFNRCFDIYRTFYIQSYKFYKVKKRN